MNARGASAIVLLALVTTIGFSAQVAAAPDEQTLAFSAAGDFGAGTNSAAVMSTIGARHNDLTLALGDLSYGQTGQEQSWCDFVTSRVGKGYPFELISGNHESSGQNGNINDFSACLPNQLPGVVGTYGRQYYVDVPAVNPLVRFVMISPGIPYVGGTWNYDQGTDRYNWTEQAIDGARAANIPWVVVGMHKPCLTLAERGCETGSDIVNLLLSKKVDLVLSGHEHTYQRAKQLSLGAGCPALIPGTYTAACVADADSALIKGAGTVMATVGTGGVAQHDINSSDSEAGYFAASAGANQNQTFGMLEVTAAADSLSAEFKRASGGTFTDSFTIRKQTGTTNAPPVAAFHPSCDHLTCVFDGSTSSDSDGTLTSYAWSFGDSETAATTSPTHSYGTAGTYPVQLTVTDDRGATNSTSQSVTVTDAPQPTVIANDDFARTVVNGFGSAPAGGPWRLGTAPSNFAVAGGVGSIRVASGSGPSAYLTQTSARDVDMRLDVTTDKPASGSGLYLWVVGRRVEGVGEYRARLKLNSNGSVNLSLTRLTGTEVMLQGEVAVPGLRYTPGDVLKLRLQVLQTGTTEIRAKVWKSGAAEPTSWLRSTTDGTAALQAPGQIGVALYLSSAANNSPITVRLDNLSATIP